MKGKKQREKTANLKNSLLFSLFSVHHRALARPAGHETFATRVGGTKGW
jgi:hypothetical protein